MNSILLVGNCDVYVDLIKKSNKDYDVLTIDSINDILNFISNKSVSLIFLVTEDNFFEDVNNIEHLKKDKKYRDIPVIIVDKAPFPISNNIQLAFQSGCTDYLKGEIDDVELLSRIDKQINYYKHLSEIKEENLVNKEVLKLMDKLVLFMDKADNSFIIFNKKYEIEWVNDGFSRMYGYTVNEFKDKFGSTIFEASQNPDIEENVKKCIDTKKSVHYISECQTNIGKYKWIQTTFTPILSSTDEIERFIAIETDITKIKETEEALNQRNEYMLALTNHLKSTNALLEKQQREINQQNEALKEEREKSEELLLNILPFEVARQLKSKGKAKPKGFKLTTVLFLDFVGFTKLTQKLSHIDLISILDSYFKKFDDIVDKHYVEKIKTIGDAYMCVGGLPLRNRSNPFNVVLAGLEMQHVVENMAKEIKAEEGQEWRCRIGIHTGPVIAGVVGKKKYIYDIWGNTVNIAARMQEEGASGMVNVSGETYDKIKDYFDCTYRGRIAMKKADDADMYFVNRIKQEYSKDKKGFIPNEAFIKMLNSL